MVVFSTRSMRAYAALYAPYNDIDIYVEDRSLIGLYERVFAKMLRGRGRITSVTPLDGKREVLSEAHRLRSDRTRTRFFLIDGDFDWSLGQNRRVRDVYMLRCYSFENLAWELDAIVRTGFVLAPDLSQAEVRAVISAELVDETVRSLLPLFISYATCFKLRATCETVGFSVARLVDEIGTYKLSKRKVGARLREVYRHLKRAYGIAAVSTTRKRILATLRERNRTDARLISGKDYLVPLLMFLFQQRVRYRGNRNQLVSMIFENASFKVDPGLRRALRRKAYQAAAARFS